MTVQHWNILLDVIKGKTVDPLPIGFVIDCPWLPNWYGVRIIDYFSNDQIWLDANLKAIAEFPGSGSGIQFPEKISSFLDQSKSRVGAFVPVPSGIK